MSEAGSKKHQDKPVGAKVTVYQNSKPFSAEVVFKGMIYHFVES